MQNQNSSNATSGDAFAGFAMLTFDCYGTLIDWESGIWRALRPLLRANGEDDSGDARARFLEAFARHESAAQKESPSALYPKILQTTHARSVRRIGLRLAGV